MYDIVRRLALTSDHGRRGDRGDHSGRARDHRHMRHRQSHSSYNREILPGESRVRRVESENIRYNRRDGLHEE